MILPVWSLAVLALARPEGPPPLPRDGARLVKFVDAIRAADYRGDRAELRRLDGALDAFTDARLAAYRRYWQGFAKWRRAINGFNETPLPADLVGDLEGAVSSFRAALVENPDWIEPRVGIVGAEASLLYLAGDDQERKRKLLADFVPLLRELTAKGGDNPRALWLIGGMQLQAPPPYGGDAVKASATLRKALEAARLEASESGAAPAYSPTWGAAENLMNLAYLFSHSALRNQGAALAYAEGALAAAPEWHYVRDILRPQIQAMGDDPSPAGDGSADRLRDEVTALERAALDRWMAGDPQGYLDLFAPEVTYFDPFVEARVDGIEAMKTLLAPLKDAKGRAQERHYEMIAPSVQGHGEVAVLSFNLVSRGEPASGPQPLLARWNSTEVYRRIDGKWRIIHSHWSFVKPPSAAGSATSGRTSP